MLTNIVNMLKLSKIGLPATRHCCKIHHILASSFIQYTNGSRTYGHNSADDFKWKSTQLTEVSSFRHYLKLSKIKLTGLVIVTAMAGYGMAPNTFELCSFISCSVGTGFLSAAANSINQYNEVPFDAQMLRTKHRVLVNGRITPLHSIIFASTSCIIGLAVLYTGANSLAAALGITNLILYTFIYTPMKRISKVNTWVGSLVGSIPPLIGWSASANSLDFGAFVMAAILYSWQFPHFNALSWNLRPDYSKAGYRMMAVTDPLLCLRVTLRHTIALSGLCGLTALLDVTHWMFVLQATPINAYFTYLAYKFYYEPTSKNSRILFRFSIVYLPLIMFLLILNRKKVVSKTPG